MSAEKPHDPTPEEIKKAEDVMTDQEMSEEMEGAYKNGYEAAKKEILGFLGNDIDILTDKEFECRRGNYQETARGLDDERYFREEASHLDTLKERIEEHMRGKGPVFTAIDETTIEADPTIDEKGGFKLGDRLRVKNFDIIREEAKEKVRKAEEITVVGFAKYGRVIVQLDGDEVIVNTADRLKEVFEKVEE